MGDIAKETGISRPALYLQFASKEDVFAAVVRKMDRDWHEGLEGVLFELPTVEQQLRHVCGEWAAHGIDLVQTHPDAKDLFDLKFEAVREMYDHFETVVAALIEEATRAAGLDATPRELARSLIYAMRGIKDAAEAMRDVRDVRDAKTSAAETVLGARAADPRAAKAAKHSRSSRSDQGTRGGRAADVTKEMRRLAEVQVTLLVAALRLGGEVRAPGKERRRSPTSRKPR